MVRCSHCKTAWRAEPGDRPLEQKPAREEVETLTTPAAPADLPGEALPKQFRARVKEETESRKLAVAGAVWGGMAVLLALVVGLALLFRQEVAHAWPRSASAFAAVGLPVNVVGLAVENITTAPGIENGREVLVFGGDVRNVSNRPRKLPPALRIELTGKDGQSLATGEVKLKPEVIPVDQARPFTYRFFEPPSAATGWRSDFVLSGKPDAPRQAHGDEPRPHG